MLDSSLPPRQVEFPPSFGDAAKPGYLGSPAVVSGLLRDYCARLWGLAQQIISKDLTPGDASAAVHKMGQEFAAIFAGEDPAYQPVVGWNSRVGGLNSYLKVDLGQWWTRGQAECGGDPFRVMFTYVWWYVSEAVKQSHVDGDAALASLADHSDRVCRILLGTNRRGG